MVNALAQKANYSRTAKETASKIWGIPEADITLKQKINVIKDGVRGTEMLVIAKDGRIFSWHSTSIVSALKGLIENIGRE